MPLNRFAAVVFALFPSIAQAQALDEVVIDPQLNQIGSARYFLERKSLLYGAQNFQDTDDAIRNFCENSYDSSTIILSRRITEDDLSYCYSRDLNDMVEVFSRYEGYMYFDLGENRESAVTNYRFLTDPNMDADSYELENFLNRRPKLRDLLMTNAPETCTTGNSLACADGTYCCKGTCIDNDEECD